MISTRVDAVTAVLTQLDNQGRPRGVFSPLCRTLNVGMQGRYHLVREDDGELRPKKDRYSNPCDALQYLVIGMGEGQAMVGRSRSMANKAIRVHAGGRRNNMRRVS